MAEDLINVTESITVDELVVCRVTSLFKFNFPACLRTYAYFNDTVVMYISRECTFIFSFILFGFDKQLNVSEEVLMS